MMSMYSAVCRIYTARHSGHLRYASISVQPLSLLEDAVGGCDGGCFEKHLETGIE